MCRQRSRQMIQTAAISRYLPTGLNNLRSCSGPSQVAASLSRRHNAAIFWIRWFAGRTPSPRCRRGKHGPARPGVGFPPPPGLNLVSRGQRSTTPPRLHFRARLVPAPGPIPPPHPPPHTHTRLQPLPGKTNTCMHALPGPPPQQHLSRIPT